MVHLIQFAHYFTKNVCISFYNNSKSNGQKKVLSRLDVYNIRFRFLLDDDGKMMILLESIQLRETPLFHFIVCKMEAKSKRQSSTKW